MTAEDGTLIAPGTRLVNAFNKETFIFHDPREGLPSAAFRVLLDAGGSGGGNAVAHIHPESDEHFTVHAGVLKVMIDGQPRSQEPARRSPYRVALPTISPTRTTVPPG